MIVNIEQLPPLSHNVTETDIQSLSTVWSTPRHVPLGKELLTDKFLRIVKMSAVTLGSS